MTAASKPFNWPPLAQDVWADRDGTEYVANVFESDDRVITQMLRVDMNHQITPDYLLETRHPLRLVAAGWQRVAS